MQGQRLIFISEDRLIQVLKVFSLSLCTRALLSQVVDSQDHVLRGNCHRAAIGGLQQVVRGKQHETAFRLRFHGQRKMHCHLVTVKVSIERGTYQGVQLNCLTFHQDGFKRLDTEPMQRRSAVEHHRMLFDHIFQHIPYLRIQPFHQLLRILDVLRNSSRHQFLHHEGFEQLDRHLLRQTALINLQFRSNYDNASSGIVNTLTQQVLTETSGFTFQHIGKGF